MFQTWLCSGRSRSPPVATSYGWIRISTIDLENSEGPREVDLLEVLMDQYHHIRWLNSVGHRKSGQDRSDIYISMHSAQHLQNKCPAEICCIEITTTKIYTPGLEIIINQHECFLFENAGQDLYCMPMNWTINMILSTQLLSDLSPNV